LGYSFTTSYLWLCLMAVPMGLGAGAVDASLNDFVARNYSSKHMSWLHAFWGVGATAGPLLMAGMISLTGRWQNGYRSVSFVQFGLVAILIASLSLWKKFDHASAEAHSVKLSNGSIWKIPGMGPNLAAFFAYCSLELTAGLWFASYLVQIRGVKPETAAAWAASYYFGIMLGRMINGFLTLRFSSKTSHSCGQTSILLGILLLFLPGNTFSLIGLFVGRDGLRADLSFDAARDTCPLWQGKFLPPDGHPDGFGLCGALGGTAPGGSARLPLEFADLPLRVVDLAGADGVGQ
jgi:fucose permease